MVFGAFVMILVAGSYAYMIPKGGKVCGGGLLAKECF